MDIIFGTHIDLITPFPESEISRIWPWLQCFKSLVFHDYSAQQAEYEEYFRAVNTQGLTYGIIDKMNITGSTKVEAPIVGMVLFEPSTPTNFYGHIAMSRKAGKSFKLYGVSMADEAVNLSTQYAFDTYPNLTRISSVILESNTPVRNLMKRTNFTQDGYLEDWFTQNGEPKNAIHYGKLKRS
jgi:RimJ/RimL family protein N-acetyltransferase